MILEKNLYLFEIFIMFCKAEAERCLSNKMFLACFEAYSEIPDLPLSPETILFGFRHMNRVSSSVLILDQLSLLHQVE